MTVDTAEREALVERHTPLVRSIVRRFEGRGKDLEDLFQIGVIGLLKAIDGFDDSLGFQFSTYAVPRILGEIKQFLRRDNPVKISRGFWEKGARIEQVRQDFIKKQGREPTLSQLAAETGLDPEEIALCTGAGQAVLSLDAPVSETGEGAALLDLQQSPEILGPLLDHLDLKAALAHLTPDERRLLSLRYTHELTQQKTAAILGLTQVKVSRLERKILDKLRQQLTVEN